MGSLTKVTYQSFEVFSSEDVLTGNEGSSLKFVCILSSVECSFRIRSNISRIDRTSGRFAKNAFLRFVVRKLNLRTVINVDSSSFRGPSSILSVRARL